MIAESATAKFNNDPPTDDEKGDANKDSATADSKVASGSHHTPIKRWSASRASSSAAKVEDTMSTETPDQKAERKKLEENQAFSKK